MFKLSAVTQSYLTPVTVTIPDGTKNGTKHILKARFKRLSQDELKELFRNLNRAELAKGVEDGEQAKEPLTDEEVAHQVMTGWEDVMDADGNALEFNADNLNEILGIHPVPAALVRAFFDSLNAAKQKN